jgi:NAD(P)-dependent dehydrogenase (short-subunit alcohol dehydrogenase family)
MNPYNCPNTFCDTVPIAFPPQHQNVQPGIENIMVPIPISNNPYYFGSQKLQNKVAIITGGDSGIGKSVSILYAKEGADIVIVYFKSYEREDALETQKIVESVGRRAILLEGDISEESFCINVVNKTIETFGHIDIIVNNAAVLYIQDSIENITIEQLTTTFKTNVFSYFLLVKAALPYLKRGSSIINTSSVTAFEPYTKSIDYSASKGAVVAFTRSLAKSLIPYGIRVNSIAPGMTWTPLITSTQNECDVMLFGRDRPMGRAAQPIEISPSYVFLASEIDSSYITGQVITVN